MRTVARLGVALIPLALLAPAAPAAAFLGNATVTSDESRFSVDPLDQPQWTLVTREGDVYRGQSLDSAKFRGTFGLAFSDQSAITLNGETVDVKLKGKFDGDCVASVIKLKDLTNGRTITLEFPGELVSLSCSAF